MDLIADRGRRVTVEELNTTRLLAHARKQAQQRKFDDILIVDVDAHHYENECMDDILPFVENDVIRQLAIAGRAKGRGSLVPSVAVGFQDMGGRITRYPLRSSEKTEKGKMRDVQLGHRWMDAMSVDYSCLFPTLMLVDRPASRPRDGGRAVLGLQPLAHREGAAGIRRALLFDAEPAAVGARRGDAPDRDLRRPQGRRRLHDHLGARPAGAPQPAHEGLSRARGARAAAVVPLRHQSDRAGVQDAQPLRLGARARLPVLQHPARDQLGHQRHSASASRSCR